MAVFTHVPVAGTQLSLVQVLLSLQLRGVPDWQTPARQVSLPVHSSLSSHCASFMQSTGNPQAGAAEMPALKPGQYFAPTGVPEALQMFWHPLAGSHESSVQRLASAQLRGAPAAQAPAWQVSAPLHALPSPQEVPFDKLLHPAGFAAGSQA